MATLSSKGIQPSNNTDTLFRAWSKFIFDGIIAGGWVQTSDTGQINFTTVTRPTLTNEARGYVVVRMDDSVQATAPVYMRLDFGSAGAANNMGLWVTLGASSDGAGAIVNPWFSSPTASAPPVLATGNSTSMVQPYSFISAGTARVHFAIAINSTSDGNLLLFSLERTKNPAGQDDSTGLLMYWSAGVGNLSRNQYLFAAELPQPPREDGFAAVLPLRNPSVTSQNWGIGVPFPFAGLAQQPGMGFLVTQTLDATVYGRFGIDVYGQRVTYQALFSANMTGFGHDGTSVILMRFD